MTPADCKPGTVVMWGDYVGVVQESSLAEATALAMGLIEPGECVGVRSDAGHHLVEPAALQLAPRFLVGEEWMHVEPPYPPNVRAVIDWAHVSHPSLPSWHWSVYDWTAGTVLRNYAPTFAAARQAVERACGVASEPAQPMRCRSCGSENVGYDTNPKGLPVIHTCLMGCDVTGEPGAERCNDCGSLDVEDVAR